MDVPQGLQSSSDILVEALEEIQPRGITRVIVMCFDDHGNPVGWLSNVSDKFQRFGLIEVMKQNMHTDED